MICSKTVTEKGKSMKRESQYRAYAAVMLALLTSIGCSTGQTAEKPVETSKIVDKDQAYVSSEHLQTVYFGISQSKLDEVAKEALKKNAEWLAQNPPFLLELASYTDNRGGLLRNRTLAERRAMTVKDFYASLGINPDRIAIATIGAEEPTCPTLTEDCLAKSRRTETLIENKALASR